MSARVCLRMASAPVFVNSAGEVWFASSGHGLDRWLGYNLWETWTSSGGLTKRYSLGESFATATGRLWVGNDNGLAFLDPGAKRFTPWPLPGFRKGSEFPVSLESNDGAVWVGTGSTVVRIDPVTHSCRLA